MKFVSKISISALFILGLAVSFVGCQKNEEADVKTSSQLVNGFKYTSYSKLTIPANHLKSFSITYGKISKIGNVAYVNNGTSITTWKMQAELGAQVERSTALAKGTGGWHVPSNANYQDLYFACWYAGIQVNDILNFYNYDGLLVKYTGETTWHPIFVGSGYFWLSDLISPLPNYTYLLGVNQPNDAPGTSQCQVPAEAYVYLVK